MTFRQTMRVFCFAAVLGAITAGTAAAQQAPTPTALLLAKELIDLKGATKAFDPIISGAIQYHKNLFIQTNPNLARDIEDVARNLLAELEPRNVELHQQLARVYAEHFTVDELKDLLAFYRTPLGKKLIAEEPRIADDAMKSADAWSQKLAEEVVAKMRAEMKKRGFNLI
jgi:hypothetical protein